MSHGTTACGRGATSSSRTATPRRRSTSHEHGHHGLPGRGPAGQRRRSRPGSCELSEAFQAGRITASEFDQRSQQALDARTGNELTPLLADLPHERARAEAIVPAKAHRALAAWIVAGTSAAAATSLAALAVTNALSHAAPRHYDRQLAQQVLAHLGLKVTLPPPPPAPGFDWVGTITPAVIAALLVAVIIVAVRVALCTDD